MAWQSVTTTQILIVHPQDDHVAAREAAERRSGMPIDEIRTSVIGLGTHVCARQGVGLCGWYGAAIGGLCGRCSQRAQLLVAPQPGAVLWLQDVSAIESRVAALEGRAL